METLIEPGIGAAPVNLQKSAAKKSVAVAPLNVDRLPPHAIEAEQGVLGCVLLSPNDSVGVCIEKLKGGHEAFYDLRHQVIYQLLVEMYDQKDAIDPITVMQRLKDKNQLDGVGGVTYLAALADGVP